MMDMKRVGGRNSTGQINPVDEGNIAVDGNPGATSSTSTGKLVAGNAATLVLANIPQALRHPHADLPPTSRSSPFGAQPAPNWGVPPPRPIGPPPEEPPPLPKGHALNAAPQPQPNSGMPPYFQPDNARGHKPPAPRASLSSSLSNIPSRAAPQLQVQGKASGTVALSHTSGTQPAQDPRMSIKVSKSTSALPGDTARLHYWKYHGAKAGGAHGAGEKGGVHALVNDKGEYVDLKGNKLNPLNAMDQAKDQVGRTFTIIRDKDKNIVGVSYGPGQDLAVTKDAAGCLKCGNEIIAKIDKPQLALIKQEASNAKNMTEYIGSVVFRSRHPDLFPEVHLVNTGSNKFGTGADIYAASIYIENYTCDLYKDIHKRNKQPVPDSKPPLFGMTSGTREEIRKAFVKNDEGFKKYENFEKVTVPALRGDEFDMHTGNIGLKGENQLVRIDLAGAWRKICKHPLLRPNSSWEHPVGMGPSNRFAQYDDSLKLNAAFVDELDKDVKHDYDQPIRSSIMELTAFYDVDSFKELANWVGINTR
jgi:hypothetical protein